LGRKKRLGAVLLFQDVHVSMYKNIFARFAPSAVDKIIDDNAY